MSDIKQLVSDKDYDEPDKTSSKKTNFFVFLVELGTMYHFLSMESWLPQILTHQMEVVVDR